MNPAGCNVMDAIEAECISFSGIQECFFKWCFYHPKESADVYCEEIKTMIYSEGE